MEDASQIKLPNPYKIQNKLNTLNKIGNKNISTFVGSLEVLTMFYLYLFKKYKSNCFLHDKKINVRLLGMAIDIKNNYLPNEKMKIRKHLVTLADILVDCIQNVDTKIIIIPVSLIFDDGGHANVLIYRKNLQQLEHFEPQGQMYSRGSDIESIKMIQYWMNYFVSKINANLLSHKMPLIKFIESTEVCPYIDGLQNLESWSSIPEIMDVEPGGYCAAWSMFFTELSLKNPDIPSLTLMNYIFNVLNTMTYREQKNYLKSVIRGYSFFINEKIDKYFSVFDKSGLTIEKVSKFSDAELLNFRKILKEIVLLEINLATNPLYVEQTLESLKKRLETLRKQTGNVVTLNKIEMLVGTQKIYEKYENFKISNPTETTSKNSPEGKEIPAQKVEIAKVCPEGKEINPKTGRCIKIKTQKVRKITPKQKVEIAKVCPEGKEINPKTGRCIKIKTQKVRKITTPKQNVEIAKVCPEGKEINPKTGRCIKTRKQK
jgi:hypothetical protein